MNIINIINTRKINKLTIWRRPLILLVIFFVFLSLAAIWPINVSAAATYKNINFNVPFTSQAPLFEWKDARQQDACEEASVLMAMAWVNNEKNKTKTAWRDAIVTLANWEQNKYKEHRDVALADVVARLFKKYFSYEAVTLKAVSSAADILKELENGNLVLIQTNGQKLKNPNFTGLGPERHMLLIKGYDYKKKEFITNDPGTRRGADYHYPEKIIFSALRSYKTGYKLPFGPLKREMIVVSRLASSSKIDN